MNSLIVLFFDDKSASRPLPDDTLTILIHIDPPSNCQYIFGDLITRNTLEDCKCGCPDVLVVVRLPMFIDPVTSASARP
jgi:hypothetical protein